VNEAEAIARALQESSGEEDDQRVLARLKESPDVASVLEELACDSHLEVRGWVPEATRALLGRDAIPLIQRLAEDRDPDIRGLAVDALEAIDPKLLRSLSTSLRKRLRSKDESEVLATAWRVAQAGDFDGVPAIEAFRDRNDLGWWQHKAATVVLLAMQDPAEVPRRIRAHDHDHMGWLSYAATWIDEPDRRPALEFCRDNGPDEGCRTLCAWALKDH
jgi:HEAT repeat protein